MWSYFKIDLIVDGHKWKALSYPGIWERAKCNQEQNDKGIQNVSFVYYTVRFDFIIRIVINVQSSEGHTLWNPILCTYFFVSTWHTLNDISA